MLGISGIVYDFDARISHTWDSIRHEFQWRRLFDRKLCGEMVCMLLSKPT